LKMRLSNRGWHGRKSIGAGVASGAIAAWARPRRLAAGPFFPRRLPNHGGFTLVELLVVITIIGILVGLLSVAAIRARRQAKNAAVLYDLSQIEQALEAYAQQYGEYPPDFTDHSSVLAHLRVRFPQCSISNWEEFQSAVRRACELDVNKITPASALVFWLAGLPPSPGQKPQGFHPNPLDPFQGGQPRTGPFYEFHQIRLKPEKPPENPQDTDHSSPSWWVYYPPYLDAPLVYFRARGGTYSGQYSHSSAGVAVPYQDKDGNWRNPRSFQLITCGFDGVYGRSRPPNPPRSESGQYCTPEDYDNHTNFAKGTIEDEIRKNH
jgi:prepilin-type N-terminal cleavage/methylation domain-containing protein